MNKIYRDTKLTGKHNGSKDKKKNWSATLTDGLMGYQGTAIKRDFVTDKDANLRVQNVGCQVGLFRRELGRSKGEVGRNGYKRG